MESSSTSNSKGWLEPQPWPGSDKRLSMMDRIFNHFDGAYQHKWRSCFPNQQAVKNWRETWARGFVKVELTVPEIATGLDNCLTDYTWPPSLPEFVAACRKPIDPEHAFYEAVEQLRLRDDDKDCWSNPAVYWAATTLGKDLMGATYSVMSKRWARALEKALKQIKNGERPNQVPVRRKALPAPAKAAADRAHAAANISKMKAILAGGKDEQE